MGEIIIGGKVFNFNEIELTYKNVQELNFTIVKNKLLDLLGFWYVPDWKNPLVIAPLMTKILKVYIWRKIKSFF